MGAEAAHRKGAPCSCSPGNTWLRLGAQVSCARSGIRLVSLSFSPSPVQYIITTWDANKGFV